MPESPTPESRATSMQALLDQLFGVTAAQRAELGRRSAHGRPRHQPESALVGGILSGASAVLLTALCTGLLCFAIPAGFAPWEVVCFVLAYLVVVTPLLFTLRLRLRELRWARTEGQGVHVLEGQVRTTRSWSSARGESCTFFSVLELPAWGKRVELPSALREYVLTGWARVFLESSPRVHVIAIEVCGETLLRHLPLGAPTPHESG